MGLPIPMASAPLYSQQAAFDPKALARRLTAIEEKQPYHLRNIVRNGQPNLIGN